MKIDDTILKVRFTRNRIEGILNYPYIFLPHTPSRPCVFDSFHGTIGFYIFPFAVTTRINASNQVFLKVYEDVDDPAQGQGA
jgi:hypothetical protein